MKKGQVYEGIIESVEFPNKGRIYLPEEDRWVVVKNGVPGQKVRFSVNKIRKGKAEGRLLEVLEPGQREWRGQSSTSVRLQNVLRKTRLILLRV